MDRVWIYDPLVMGNCVSSSHSNRDSTYDRKSRHSGRPRSRNRRSHLGRRRGANSMSSHADYGSPRSVISEETIYYSDENDDAHSVAMTDTSSNKYSSLRHSTVNAHPESTLVDKIASWWHSFSIFDEDDRSDDHPLGGEEIEKVIVEDDEAQAPGCISLLTAAQVIRAQRRFLSVIKAGESVQRVSLDPDNENRKVCSWAAPDPTTFLIRSKGYMKDKIKVPALCSLYTLVECDNFSFDTKVDHIAEHVELPVPSEEALEASKRLQLPPLLIVHLQMPMYSPSLFGPNNGDTCSLIYYSELNGACEAPEYALDMARRLIQDGVEEDGQRTRDRLKLLPRIVNVDEWGELAPLSNTELKLVKNYNGKPLLMRPQQRFFTGQEGQYFEIDVDIHNYAYIARRAFYGYVPRLGPAVFENGFVIQGNNENELPEILLMCARVFRIDFTKTKKLEQNAHQ